MSALVSDQYVVWDFPYSFRWDMVRAYPVISGVPDAREATREDIDAGFRLIMASRNLQTTLRLALADPGGTE